MSLKPGTRVGPYEVLGQIGAGGMGEVYRARDPKLNRDVALKILPETFAADPDRLARFRREAQVLASLNHPHIAHIHGFEDSGPAHALVMELVEGPTLAERIDGRRGEGGLPLPEVLAIARQIADALEAAHEQGIVHRDLKPANVKVRDDGTVKVLDFGLAKALAPEGASAAAGAMNSPTLTGRATQLGVVLGTAAYMAPEQARGRAVDRRADIWAFGIVLYEMLTGRRAFDGDDISITLASVLKEDPDWTVLPADLPTPFRRLLRRCLEKDPKRRLSAIGDARFELEEAAAAPESASSASIALPVGPPGWRRTLPWVLSGASFAGLAAAVVLWAPLRARPALVPLRLSAEIGADASLTIDNGAAAILSPDGGTVAFLAQSGGRSRLYVRKLDRLQATALAGTEDAQSPFFSFDGAWIAFFANGKLKKISVTGGAAVTLCDAPTGRGGWWSEDDTIVLTPNSVSNTSLVRVSAAGGTAQPIGRLAEGEVTQRWPQVLPRGKGVLYSGNSTTGGFESGNLLVQPADGGAPKIVLRGGFHGRYLSSGHLVYLHQGTLFAVPFDLDRLEPSGQPAPVLEGVASNSTTGGAQFAVSPNGTIVYVAGKGAGGEVPIQWMDRAGKVSPLRATASDWYGIRFSPDGQKLALQISDGNQYDVWVYEWARDTLTKLTFDPAADGGQLWTPDGRRIVFYSDRAVRGIGNLYWQRADGTGDVERLTDVKNDQRAASFHPSGKFLALQERRPNSNWDLMILPLEGDELKGWKPLAPTVFLSTPATEVMPMFSPDGRWIAYWSDESGRFEVYVRPFPGPGGKWQISSDGGLWATWSRTKRELFYVNAAGSIFVNPYAVEGESFRRDKPQLWSPGRSLPRGVARPLDLHPDGQRFALAAPDETAGERHDKVVFVFNFFDELRRVAPVKK